MAGNEQQIADVWMPVVESLHSGDDVRRARRVDRVVGNDGKLMYEPSFAAAWNGNNPLRLGTWHLWIDAAGRLRVKNGKATSDGDGVVVGGQV